MTLAFHHQKKNITNWELSDTIMAVTGANGVKFMFWTDVYWEKTICWVSTVIRVKVSMGDCV